MIALRISFILVFRIFPQFTRRTPVHRYLLRAVATLFKEYRVEVVPRGRTIPGWDGDPQRSIHMPNLRCPNLRQPSRPSNCELWLSVQDSPRILFVGLFRLR